MIQPPAPARIVEPVVAAAVVLAVALVAALAACGDDDRGRRRATAGVTIRLLAHDSFA